MAQVSNSVKPAMISRKRSILDISCSKQQPSTAQKRKIVRVISALPARLISNTDNKTVQSPQENLLSVLSNLHIEAKVFPFDAVDDLFIRPSAEEIAAYGLDIIDAVRKKNIEQLRTYHKNGRPLQCSNQFGESILHLACRKGLLEVVDFLVVEAKVSLWRKDDFGRTCLHDACWASEPNFKLLDILLDSCPDLLFISDARAHTPLNYVRRNHWDDYNKYLKEKAPSLKPTRLDSYFGIQPSGGPKKVIG